MTMRNRRLTGEPRAGHLPPSGLSARVGVAVLAASLFFTVWTGEWIGGVGLVVLGGIWLTLRDSQLPPVLPLALTFQWLQVTSGLYYFELTGRQAEAIVDSDYRPMVLIGLGCVTALWMGLALGRSIGPRTISLAGQQPLVFRWSTLFTFYIATLFLTGAVREVAWLVPGLTQAIFAVSNLHLAVTFLMFRRLVSPRFRTTWFLGLLCAEVVVGLTGYFASFREPMLLATLAMLEKFQPNVKQHWIRLGALVAAVFFAGLLWIGVRTTYRAEFDEGLFQTRSARAERVGELSSEWVGGGRTQLLGDLDLLIDRIWVVYYPALAVQRVPRVLPHEGGNILLGAVKHMFTPRLLFPDKPVLPSDSEMVRKYSGIMVAGAEENTSIAFGYAAEAYVDFGVPVMFLPSLFFGVLMGFAYRWAYRKIVSQEIAIGYVAIVFWLSLYLFERSWIKTLGLSVTLLVFLGGIAIVLDRYLTRARVPARLPRFRSDPSPMVRARR